MSDKTIYTEVLRCEECGVAGGHSKNCYWYNNGDIFQGKRLTKKDICKPHECQNCKALELELGIQHRRAMIAEKELEALKAKLAECTEILNAGNDDCRCYARVHGVGYCRCSEQKAIDLIKRLST